MSCVKFKQPIVHVIELQKEKDKKTFEETMHVNFPNLIKTIHSQVQGAQ